MLCSSLQLAATVTGWSMWCWLKHVGGYMRKSFWHVCLTLSAPEAEVPFVLRISVRLHRAAETQRAVPPALILIHWLSHSNQIQPINYKLLSSFLSKRRIKSELLYEMQMWRNLCGLNKFLPIFEITEVLCFIITVYAHDVRWVLG